MRIDSELAVNYACDYEATSVSWHVDTSAMNFTPEEMYVLSE
jgi:hypothetical protein